MSHLVGLYARKLHGHTKGVRKFDSLVRKVKHIDRVLTSMTYEREKASSRAIVELQRQRTFAMTELESILQEI